MGGTGGWAGRGSFDLCVQYSSRLLPRRSGQARSGIGWLVAQPPHQRQAAATHVGGPSLRTRCPLFCPAWRSIVVTGDHSTPVEFGDHSHEPVPFAIAHVRHAVS